MPRKSHSGKPNPGRKNENNPLKNVEKNLEFNFDEEYGITEAVATIDNGDFGTREVRFETGQLARQADGSVTTYLDEDTMLLATTTASSKPREGLDFFPSPWTWRSACTPPGGFPVPSSAARAAPARTPCWPAA